MAQYPNSVFRVTIDYLSKSYENRMLNVSNAYRTRDDAEKAYRDAEKERCVDDPTRPARIALLETIFPGPGEWGKTTTIKQNY